jgi:hypothetical protein
MADWFNITDVALDPDAPLTSQLGYAWRDNCIAIAEGAAGAPRIVRGALKTATGSVSGSLASGASVTVSLNQYSFWPDIRLDVANTIQVSGGGTGTASAASPTIPLHNASANSRSYSIAWRYVDA